MRFLSLLCMAALFVPGCAGKDLQVQYEGILNGQQLAERYHIDRNWWTLYGDPSLNTLVERALERNLDLARSTISVNRALYQARQLGAELVPSFSASGEGSSTTSLNDGGTSRSFNASFGLSYELDLWGRLRHAASAQAWEYRATEQDREAARLALINSVVNTWYSMAYTSRSLDLSRKSLRYYEELLRIMREKFLAGKTDGLDTAQTEQSLFAQKTTVLTLEEQFREEEQTLRNLLDMRPEEKLDLPLPDILTLAVPPVDLSVPVSALGARPDVRAAEFRLLSAFRDRQAARSDLFPSLSIGGTLGASSASSSDLFRSSFVSGLIHLNLPFLDWNRVKWNVHISEADFEDARLNFRQTLTTALNEVNRYFQALENSLQQFENIQKKYESDLRVEKYRKARYDQGADELKDWLEALKACNDSRLSLLERKYEIISSSNAVWQALGGRISGS